MKNLAWVSECKCNHRIKRKKTHFSNGILKNQTADAHSGIERVFLLGFTGSLAFFDFLGQFSGEFLLHHGEQSSGNLRWRKANWNLQCRMTQDCNFCLIFKSMFENEKKRKFWSLSSFKKWSSSNFFFYFRTWLSRWSGHLGLYVQDVCMCSTSSSQTYPEVCCDLEYFTALNQFENFPFFGSNFKEMNKPSRDWLIDWFLFYHSTQSSQSSWKCWIPGQKVIISFYGREVS